MSKRAEEAALKAYPVEMTPLVYQDVIEAFGGKTEVDFNLIPRYHFRQGYEQAEKDLALTWEDIKLVHELSEDVWEPNCDDQKCYEEVLRRFNERKNNK